MWRNTQETYGRVARWLHWCIALLFIAQIFLGFLTQQVAADPVFQFSLYQWHKSLGLLILALALLRLAWALTNVRPGPVHGVKPIEALAAHAVHRLLLILAVLVPLAGWIVVSTSPLDIPVYVLNLFAVPNLPLPVSDRTEIVWSWVHAVLAYGAGVLVLVHAGAALYHHTVRGDDTLRRMTGFRPRSGNSAG